MTTTQPTKAPIDIQAEQMADEFIAEFKFCIWSASDDLRVHYAQSVKPLLKQIHDQKTALTLAQCFASENDRLKRRVEELEKDKARLEWILNTRPPHGVVVVKDKGFYAEKFNTREKIDSAMQSPNPKPTEPEAV